MNIFDCAIKIEEEAKEFYQKLESDSGDGEMKSLFAALAAAEEEHLKVLQRMKRTMESRPARISHLSEIACVYHPFQSKRQFLAEMKNDRDFYLHAVREEEQDIRFYQDLASRTDDEILRNKLLMLADAERTHLSVIENIYSFVEEPKNYLAWGEFSNLRGL